MKKWMTMMLCVMLMTAGSAMAQETVQADDPFAAQRESAIAALMASNPGAVVDYAVRDRDDGRYEWNVFFMQDGVLGEAEVLEEGFVVRRVQLFNQTREDSLIASVAMEKLNQEKGPLTVTDLELDWDDGRLRYEGEAEKDGKRYDFEMNVDGRIVEWERD